MSQTAHPSRSSLVAAGAVLLLLTACAPAERPEPAPREPAPSAAGQRGPEAEAAAEAEGIARQLARAPELEPWRSFWRQRIDERVDLAVTDRAPFPEAADRPSTPWSLEMLAGQPSFVVESPGGRYMAAVTAQSEGFDFDVSIHVVDPVEETATVVWTCGTPCWLQTLVWISPESFAAAGTSEHVEPDGPQGHRLEAHLFDLERRLRTTVSGPRIPTEEVVVAKEEWPSPATAGSAGRPGS